MVTFEKEEEMRVGAIHLKHEIEEANILSSSLKEENSKNHQNLSDFETPEMEKYKSLQQEKEKTQAEVKERVKKLNREGKVDGDSESIEEILIESKRDHMKRREIKRVRILKSMTKAIDILSESYEGSFEGEAKDANFNLQKLNSMHEDYCGDDEFMNETDLDLFLKGKKVYIEAQENYDIDKITE